MITYPKINDNTMSLQSRQQNDIKNSTSTASSDKALKFQSNKETVFGPSSKSKPIDSSVHLMLCIELNAQI